MTIITPTGISGITSITSTGSTLQFSSASGGNLNVNGLNVTSGTNINVSGVVTATSIVVSAGSTAAPSISPTGDSNTGIFFPAADTVAISEGGTEVLRVDSAGRVGIATNNPASTLDVGGEVTIRRTAPGNEGGQLNLARASDNASAWYLDVYGSTSTPDLRFVDATAAAVRMQIDGSGRVTMPYQSAFYALHSGSSGTNQQNTTVILDSPQINRGSAYSTSTGRYTCPVAGLYQFFFGTIKSDNGVVPDGRVSRFRIRKNGSNVSTELRLSENGGYGESASMVCLVECVANDFIDVYITDTGGWYGNTYAHFGGFLIG